MAAVAVLAVAWSRKPAPRQVPASRVERAGLLSLITTNATAEPSQWQAVVAQMAGRIESVRVKAGDKVWRGAALAAISDPAIESEAAAGEAALKEAEASLEASLRGGPAGERAEIGALESKLRVELASARRDRAAIERLAAKDAATRAELEAASDRVARIEAELKSTADRRVALVETASSAVAASRVNQARQALEAVLARKRRAVLTAPVSGVVYELSARPGDWMQPGAAAARVGVMDPMRLKVFVDEPDLGRVTKGMKLKVSWDAAPGEVWEAAVVQTPAQVTALGTRMVGEVIAEMPNPAARVPSGANLNVEIEAERIEGALTVPKEALRRRDGALGVLAVEDGVLRWRTIRTGISSLSLVEVIDGLREGDTVVSSSDPQYVEFMKVTPVMRGAAGK
ncbi:MAG: hypothetical protein C0504_19370 [Candidatus Solibacter sp.]|nr:hypothetical protein [Candidatus Solibacter sp.]